MPRSSTRVKVLYISGSARSGSTVLTKALGELDDVFAAGELRLIWQRSYINGDDCGCGMGFRECAVWSEVTERTFVMSPNVDPRTMVAMQPKRRYVPLALLPPSDRFLARFFKQYIANLDALYSAIADTTECRVIVDSSKIPLYAHILQLAPSVDLYVLHLMRDPHGVEYSRLRRKEKGDPRFRDHRLWKSALSWCIENAIHEVFGRRRPSRYLRIRYEDLMEAPVETIDTIGRFLGELNLGTPPIVDGKLALHTNHTIAGSENRGETGAIPLRLDNAWQQKMRTADRRTVTGMTFPLLRHYGYSRQAATQGSLPGTMRLDPK